MTENLHRARRRTEESEAKEREQHEKLRVTLASIGDAVIATNAEGRVTFMNHAAESLTGWRRENASTRPLADIFNIINEQTRQTVENPAPCVMREGQIVSSASHTAHAATFDQRMGSVIARRGDQWRAGRARARSHRTQRQVAEPTSQRPVRRVAHHHGQDAH